MLKRWDLLLTLLFYPTWMPKAQIHGDYDCGEAQVQIDTDLEQLKITAKDYQAATNYGTLIQRDIVMDETFQLRADSGIWMTFSQGGNIFISADYLHTCKKI